MSPEWLAAEEASYQAERAWMRALRWSLRCGKCDQKIQECECS